MGVDTVQAGQIVVDGILDGRGRVFADVQAQDASGLAERSLLHIGHEGIQTFVVEAQTVDQGVGFGQAEHAWLGVAGLALGRDGAHLHKAKAHATKGVDASCVFVQSCGQADAVGEFEACQFNGIVHQTVAPGPLGRRALQPGKGVQGDLVGGFGIKAEEKGAGKRIGQQ